METSLDTCVELIFSNWKERSLFLLFTQISRLLFSFTESWQQILTVSLLHCHAHPSSKEAEPHQHGNEQLKHQGWQGGVE